MSRKVLLAEIGVDDRLALWLGIHKRSEWLNNLFGGSAIVCAAVSSQLSGQPILLLITGLTAAVCSALVTFLNYRTRAITFINAWRILDGARTLFLSDENCALDSVSTAMINAEQYIQNSLHRS